MEFFTDTNGHDIFFKKTEYRCGFEVYAAEWNPRHDLLAVASRNGDVVVKRHPWKSAWKKNISMEPGILYDNPNLVTGERKTASGRGSKLESLCWSPDGDILAISLAGGLVHLVDGQDGKLLYSWRKNGPPAQKMRWLRACDAASCHVPPEDSTLHISSADFDFNENASKDRMQMMADIEHFCSQTLQTSLLGTVLCCLSKTDDGSSMTIALGGVLPLGDISNLGDFITSADPYSIEVHDVTVSSVTGKLQAVCTCCELMADAQGGATVGYSSYVVEMDLGFADLDRMQQLSRLVVRTCRIVQCAVYMREMMMYASSGWHSHSQLFHHRLFLKLQKACEQMKHRMNVCEELLGLLNTGTSAAFLFESFVALTQSKEFKSAVEFVNDCFPAFIKGTSAKLSNAMELYRHLLLAYDDDVQQILQEIATPATNKRPSTVLNAVLLSKVMMQLGKKMKAQLNTLTVVAEKNCNELRHFLSWVRTVQALNLLIEADRKDETERDTFDAQVITELIIRSVGGTHLRSAPQNPSALREVQTLDAWARRVRPNRQFSRAVRSGSLEDDFKFVQESAFDTVGKHLRVTKETPEHRRCLDLLAKHFLSGAALDEFLPFRNAGQTTILDTLCQLLNFTNVLSCLGHSSLASKLCAKKVATLPLIKGSSEESRNLVIFEWKRFSAVTTETDSFENSPDARQAMQKIAEQEPLRCESAVLAVVKKKELVCLGIFHRPEGCQTRLSIPTVNGCNRVAILSDIELHDNSASAASSKTSVKASANEQRIPNYSIDAIIPYGGGYYYGLVSGGDAKGDEECHVFRAHAFDRRCLVEKSTSTTAANAVLRLSPGRRLGVLFDKSRLRVIWFQLTAEYSKPTGTVTSKLEAMPGKGSKRLAADGTGLRISTLDTHDFDMVDLDSLDVELE